MNQRSLSPWLAGVLLGASLVAPASAQEAGPLDALGLNIHAFGDTNFLLRAPDGEHSGFQNGAIDVYMTGQLSDEWSGLVELVFENDGNDLVTDLERFQLSYDYSDRLRVVVGRMHSPIVRWNTTQHHGRFLQTPIDKPIISRWEDEPGIWPVHFTGLLASGRVSDLVWEVGLGNGRGEILDEIQVGGDANGNKAWLASLGWNPDSMRGLELRATAYVDEVPALTGAMDETDITVSAQYLDGGVEIRGEWSRMDHELIDGSADYRTEGWYVLASTSLPGRFEMLRPYVLVEDLDAADDEEFLEGATDESAWVAGCRWDANRHLAFKLDYRSSKIDDERDDSLRAQLAVSF